ncbi:uncharacterized protein PSFLO_03199 [Pseudozyma flocculosa]|uniref:Uncharacterized protein n=1 Tax=Pseudozyma flocculosa TaxID=84751 RepID=A0A5C3EZL7_9BASI|nr:uncharacterized protein PSFLO_03199 [Pseudozyma flocculosa]
MSQVACPVCQFAIARSNITAHIRRQHAGVPVSPEAAAARGLVACGCGQVVLSAAALKQHQGIKKCGGSRPATEAARPAAASPVAARTASTAVTASLAPVDPAAAPLTGLLGDAVSDAGSSVSSGPSQGAASGGAQRDGPSRERESSRQRSNGGQFSGGQASSGQPSARPSSARPSRGGRSSSDGPIRSGRSDGPHRTDRAGNSPSRGTAARSPVNEGPETPTYLRGSQPVVIIPAATARNTASSPADDRTQTPTYPQGSQPVVVIPAAPSRNRRQVQGSRSPVQQDAPPPVQVPDNIPPVLRPLEEPDMELDLPVSSPLDVDAFAVTVSPAALLSQFGRGAYITLASYAKDFDDLEHFSSWIHFGTLGVLFRCHPQYKIPLLERLRGAPQHSKVYKNEHPTAFAMGEPMLSLGIVVDALQAIGCTSVRLQGYGMKVPLQNFQDPLAFGDPLHPMCEANMYDVGCTYLTRAITLAAPALTAVCSGYRCYPSALRVGMGYGGLEFRSSSRRDGISHFKAYPVLVHVLKGVAQRAGQGGQPMNVSTVKERIKTLKDRLQKCPHPDTHGLRLEVSVRARNLAHAVQVARNSRLLDAGYLLSPEARPKQIKVRRTTMQAVLNDFDVLLSKAEAKKIFTGNHTKVSSELQRTAVVDLYNALGWNPGRKPTEWDSPRAWWEERTTTLDVSRDLEQFSSAPLTRMLFSLVREQVPCQQCNKAAPAYHLTGRPKFFRIQCGSAEGCKLSMAGKAFRSYLAHLITTNTINIDLRALVPDPATLTFQAVPEDLLLEHPRLLTILSSHRPQLQGLQRTTIYANRPRSLLHAAASMLHPDEGSTAAMASQVMERALGWLRENPKTVEDHLGSQMPAAVARCLTSIAEDIGTPEGKMLEPVLVRGIAGAYRRRVALMVVTQGAWSCMVIPPGEQGTVLGLVRTTAGYKVVTGVGPRAGAM